jgi:APA family basic amino acid/polyamine antiporter
MFWSMHSGIIAALAVICARYVAYFVPLGDVAMRLVALAAIAALSAVNYVGVAAGSALQAAVTIGKVAVIAGLVAAGFWLGADLPAHFVSGGVAGAVGIGGFAAAVAAGLFAFGGWHMVTYSAEETDDPARTIPRALVLGVAIVTLCYLGMNAVYFYVLPFDAVASSTRVAADAADAVLGYGGGAFMSAIVMFSTCGGLIGIVLAGPRVYYAMAQDGLLFRWIGGTHPRYRTPHRAIVLQAAVAVALVSTGTYRVLFTRVIYTEWIFFGLMAVGLVALRRRGVRPAYRAWGYPLLPLLFAAACGAIVVNQVLRDPAESAFGLGLVALGLPVYYAWTRWRTGRSSARHADH